MSNLFSWFRRTGASSPSNDVKAPIAEVYPLSERLIFRYWDGRRWVMADPMALHRSLMGVWAELMTAVKLSRSQSKNAARGQVEAVEILRKTFELGVYDRLTGEGRTDGECFDLFDQFYTWNESLKKTSAPSPTSSTPLEESPNGFEEVGEVLPPDGSLGILDDPRTCNSTPCGSTPAVSGIGVPESLPVESELQMEPSA